MRMFSFKLRDCDRQLLRVAALKEEISQSEFLRLAIHERASRLLGASTPGQRGVEA